MYGNCIVVRLKRGGETRVTHDSHRPRIRADAVTPTREVVSCLRCRCQCRHRSVCVRAATAHATFLCVRSGRAQRVLGGCELCRQTDVSRHRHVPRRVRVAVAPSHELITLIRRRRQRRHSSVRIRATARCRAIRQVVRNRVHFIHVYVKLRRQRRVTRHRQRTWIIRVAVAPFHEMTSFGWRRRQNRCRVIIVRAAARRRAIQRFIRRHVHCVFVHRELRRPCHVRRRRERAARTCVTVFRPFHETVTFHRTCSQRHRLTIIFHAAAAHNAIRVVRGQCRHRYLVYRERRRQVQVARDRQRSRVVRVAVTPLHEVVVVTWCRCQRRHHAIVEHATATRRAVVARCHVHRIAQNGIYRRVRSATCHRE